MNNKLNTVFYQKDENGLPIECEIMFSLECADGKTILAYTDGTRDEDGNMAMFACFCLDPISIEFPRLQPIEKEGDWRIVEEIYESIKAECIVRINAEEDETTITKRIANCINHKYANASLFSDRKNLCDATMRSNEFEQNEENCAYYLYFGLWYFSRQEYDKALSSLRTAREYDPKDISTNSLIAYILRRRLVRNLNEITTTQIENLLKDGIRAQDPFSILNLGLWYLNNTTTEADTWEMVAGLVESFDKYDRREMLRWWNRNVGRINKETMLVKLLLAEKTGFRFNIYSRFIKKLYPNMPESLFM